MILTKEKFMEAARIEEEDPYIDDLLPRAQKFVMDVARTDTEEELNDLPEGYTAVLYAALYMYERRATPNFNELALSIRALLPSRKETF